MTTQTCMGCGLQTRYSYGRTCMGCGLETRYSYPRRPDRYSRAAEALALLRRIIVLSGRHPTAALALTVPSVIIGLAAVAAYPFVFVPLLVLLSVALVVSARREEVRNQSK